MTNFKKFFYQEIKPNHVALYLWLFCILIFFSILLSSNRAISDFWGIVLLMVFVIGVISFLAIFISFFSKALLFVSSLLQGFQRKVNKRIIIVFISLSILSFLFYWFQIRPSQIKVACQMESDEYHNLEIYRDYPNKGNLSPPNYIDWINKIAKSSYERCLHRNGL